MALITLRPKTPQDPPHLFDIWLAAVVATHGFLADADLAAYSAQTEHLYLPLVPLHVIERQGVTAGFIGMTENKVDSLFVHPALHGQGLGRAAMEWVFERHACVVIDVNEQNHGARAFYAALGFREVGRSAVDAAGKPYPLLHLTRG